MSDDTHDDTPELLPARTDEEGGEVVLSEAYFTERLEAARPGAEESGYPGEPRDERSAMVG